MSDYYQLLYPPGSAPKIKPVKYTTSDEEPWLAFERLRFRVNNKTWRPVLVREVKDLNKVVMCWHLTIPTGGRSFIGTSSNGPEFLEDPQEFADRWWGNRVEPGCSQTMTPVKSVPEWTAATFLFEEVP